MEVKFSGPVTFFAPSLKKYSSSGLGQSCECYFRPVSITGGDCALKCDHCRARILSHMQPAPDPVALRALASDFAASGARGLLVSGGSDRNGRVPLGGFLSTIGWIKRDLGLKVLVHTGLVDEALAAGLAAAGVDAALIDVIGADRTIREICHLDGVTVSSYEQSLANLKEAGVPTAPHVVIGLQRGRIDGEMKALEIIRRHEPSSLVLVGITPLPGTPFADIDPPAPEIVGEIFRQARALFPDKPISLGCERPWGRHKERTDLLALEAGLDGIAFPAEGVIAAAKAMGREVRTSEMCCALLFQEEEACSA